MSTSSTKQTTFTADVADVIEVYSASIHPPASALKSQTTSTKQITFTVDVAADAIEIYSPSTRPASALKSCLKPRPTKGLGNEDGSKTVQWGEDQTFIIERVTLEFKKLFPPVNMGEFSEFHEIMQGLPFAEQPCDPSQPGSTPRTRKFYYPRSEPNVRERFAAAQAARAARRNRVRATQKVARITSQEASTSSDTSDERTSLVVFKATIPIPRIQITSADSDSDELEENYPPDGEESEQDDADGENDSNESDYGADTDDADSDDDMNSDNDSDDIGSDDVDDRELKPYFPDADAQDLPSDEPSSAAIHTQTESPEPEPANPVTETISLFSDAPTPAEFENSSSIFVKCPELARMLLPTLPLPTPSASPSFQDLSLAQGSTEPLDRLDWKLDTTTSRLGSAFVEHFPSFASDLDKLDSVTQPSAALSAPDIPMAQPFALHLISRCAALVAPILQNARDLLSVAATGLGAVVVTVGCMVLLTALTADPYGGGSRVPSHETARSGNTHTREDNSGEVPSDMKASLKVIEPRDGSLAWLDSFQNLESDLDESLFSPLTSEFHGFSGVDSYDEDEDSFLDDSAEIVNHRLDTIAEEVTEEEVEDEDEVLLSSELQNEGLKFADLDTQSVFQGR